MTSEVIGRRDELARLGAMLLAAAQGQGGTALIEGEAGIGKTRLASEISAAARRDGFAVFEGTCDDLSQSRPFGALLDALGGAAEMDADAAGAEETLSVPGMQFRVGEALASALEAAAARGPVLLLVEDLHWADVPTLAALRSIARRSPSLPVAIIATFRSGHARPELHSVVEDARRLGAIHLPVGPLSADEVASLVTQVLDAAPSGALLERVAGAAGNPLFVTDYVRALSAAGMIRLDDGAADLEEAGMPLEFRLTVQQRLGQLDDGTRTMLRMAALLGASFSSGDLAVVLNRPTVELVEPLQSAVLAGLLTDRDDRIGFGHDLVREAIYGDISRDLRRELHRAAGRALAEADADPLVVAHHLTLGADGTDEEAARWLRRAAARAAAGGPATAVELLERARALLPATSPERDEILSDLVMALAWSGRADDAEALGAEVLARRPGASVAGRLRCGLVYALTWQGRPVQALRYADPPDEEVLAAADAALLLAESAFASLLAFDFAGAAQRAAAAVEAATAIAHDLALCQALGVQTWLGWFRGDPDAVDRARRAPAVADRSTSPDVHLAHPHFFPGMVLVGHDLLDEADRVLRTGLRIAEELGLAWSLPLYHAHLGVGRFVAGEWDDAIAELESTVAIADEIGMSVAAITAAASWLAVMKIRRGDIEAAEETISRAERRLEEGIDTNLGTPILVAARALAHHARGDLESAIAILDRTWKFSVAAGMRTEPWSGSLLVRLLVEAGRNDEAAAVAAVYTDDLTPFMRGLSLSCRGLAAADPDMLLRAVAEFRESPRVPDLAQACEDAGVLLARAGRGGEAAPLLEEAANLYDRIGATRDLARVRAAQRTLGVRQGARQARTRATSGWESLTKTELEVVRLVAQRLSNPEVAARMFISRHTVESHLKHVYSKLGIRSRAELAALAAERTPAEPSRPGGGSVDGR